ncbi:hypothetical protein GALMADRAFT_144694 [Galerina marginata CBS 339.88]|uniref:Uncharacterized protein n=1 Tax=Galerina marginata (strain CBS 339.88) TaxID=685588 RepID=A0A067SUE8_GALM3|nr:hypothetical protein GALMADRAFT_144694 [Galerina marginata CBS 339.88]
MRPLDSASSGVYVVSTPIGAVSLGHRLLLAFEHFLGFATQQRMEKALLVSRWENINVDQDSLSARHLQVNHAPRWTDSIDLIYHEPSGSTILTSTETPAIRLSQHNYGLKTMFPISWRFASNRTEPMFDFSTMQEDMNRTLQLNLVSTKKENHVPNFWRFSSNRTEPVFNSSTGPGVDEDGGLVAERVVLRMQEMNRRIVFVLVLIIVTVALCFFHLSPYCVKPDNIRVPPRWTSNVLVLIVVAFALCFFCVSELQSLSNECGLFLR